MSPEEHLAKEKTKLFAGKKGGAIATPFFLRI
jgi:hypothetical protein